MLLSTADDVQEYLGTSETNLRVIQYGITHRQLLLGFGFGHTPKRVLLMTAFYLSGYLGDGTYIPRVAAGVDALWGECLILHGEPIDRAYVADDGERVVEEAASPEGLVIKFKRATSVPDNWTLPKS